MMSAWKAGVTVSAAPRSSSTGTATWSRLAGGMNHPAAGASSTSARRPGVWVTSSRRGASSGVSKRVFTGTPPAAVSAVQAPMECPTMARQCG